MRTRADGFSLPLLAELDQFAGSGLQIAGFAPGSHLERITVGEHKHTDVAAGFLHLRHQTRAAKRLIVRMRRDHQNAVHPGQGPGGGKGIDGLHAVDGLNAHGGAKTDDRPPCQQRRGGFQQSRARPSAPGAPEESLPIVAAASDHPPMDHDSNACALGHKTRNL